MASAKRRDPAYIRREHAVILSWGGHEALSKYLLKPRSQIDPDLASAVTPGRHLDYGDGGRTLIDEFAARNDVEALRLILARADLGRVRLGVALIFAVTNSSPEALRLLIARSVNVNVVVHRPGLKSYSQGVTPLGEAIRVGDVGAIDILVAAGARIHIPTALGVGYLLHLILVSIANMRPGTRRSPSPWTMH